MALDFLTSAWYSFVFSFFSLSTMLRSCNCCANRTLKSLKVLWSLPNSIFFYRHASLTSLSCFSRVKLESLNFFNSSSFALSFKLCYSFSESFTPVSSFKSSLFFSSSSLSFPSCSFWSISCNKLASALFLSSLATAIRS